MIRTHNTLKIWLGHVHHCRSNVLPTAGGKEIIIANSVDLFEKQVVEANPTYYVRFVDGCDPTKSFSRNLKSISEFLRALPKLPMPYLCVRENNLSIGLVASATPLE